MTFVVIQFKLLFFLEHVLFRVTIMQREIVHYVAALSPFIARVTVASIQVQLHWGKMI